MDTRDGHKGCVYAWWTHIGCIFLGKLNFLRSYSKIKVYQIWHKDQRMSAMSKNDNIGPS